MKRGQEIELTISSLAYGGKGVSKLNDLVIFTENVLPGQRVLVKIVKKKSSYLEARKIKIIKASSNEIKARCLHFGVCGGCKTQNLDYSVQLQYKQDQVKDIFERIGLFKNIKIKDIIPSNVTFNYRNKMEFTLSNRRWFVKDYTKFDDLPFALGLHIPKRFDKILDIEECHIQSDEANQILNETRILLAKEKFEPYDVIKHVGFIKNVAIRSSKRGQEIMINFVTSYEKKYCFDTIVHHLINKFDSIKSIVNNVNSGKSGATTGEKEILLYGKKYIIENLDNYQFKISSNSFFQTNSYQAITLYNITKKLLNLNEDQILYDLYCGTGTIGIYLADKCSSVYGFEIVKSAVEDAIENAKINNVKNINFYQCDIKDIQSVIDKKKIPLPTAIVVDPPRAGLHPNALKTISILKPKNIIYISCNPSTQARDIKELYDNNYKINQIIPIDMFPHTHHIENVTLLDKI